MTISSTYSPAQASGNDVAVEFGFTFKTFAAADLVVVLTSSAGVETTLTLTTHYSVSLNADQNNNPGGTVTMVTAPATGETLTIARELSPLQETDIANGGGFYPEVLEDALDRLTMLSQQNGDILARSLRSSVAGGAVGDLPTVADRASKYLAFDANGDPVATSSTGSGPVITAFAETLLDDANATAMRATLGVVIGTNVQAYDATILVDADIGTSVQAYDADTLKSDVTKTLTVGYSTTPYNAGTKSSGTYTPDEANGAFQYCVNGGAFTLAPPTNNCTLIIQITNNASAGTITTSGFTKITGSAPGTTNGDDFLGYITKINGFSHLNWQALQ